MGALQSLKGRPAFANMVKKTGAAKASRHKKSYWRKGADIADIERSLLDASYDTRGGEKRISERGDDELFTLDREANDETSGKLVDGLTKKQKQTLERVGKRIDEPLPTFPRKAKPVIPKAKRTSVPARKGTTKRGVEGFDLWNTDLEAKVPGLNDAEGAAHYLEQRKLRRVNVPKHLRQKPSALRPVAIPDPGASYNPAVQDFQSMMDRLTKDEKKKMEADEKFERKMRLPEGHKYVTAVERRREELEGLGVLEEEKAENEEMDETPKEEADGDGVGVHVVAKPKTKKQRRTAERIKKEDRLRLRTAQMAKVGNNAFRAKAITKALKAKAEAHEKELKERNEKKAIDGATKRKRLGRGKFEELDEEFLLAEELPGSIRALKPQGFLLEDRMKSLQKRNMLPIPGDKNKHKLKKRLKIKIKEKRGAKEVVPGSRVL